jgi:fatty-acyl-CoA synthase
VVKVDLDMAWQQFRRLPTTAREATVLLRSGIAPVTKPQDMAYALLAMRSWGMVAGAIKIAAHRFPEFPGLVDEIGELTFRELDERSNALARAWQEQEGLSDKSVIAVLCRDHRGLIETMFAEVVEREGADTLVYDAEFSEILGNVPDDVPRYLAWTDDDDNEHDTLESLIKGSSTDGLPRPKTVGGLVLLTSGTTGTPKGASRQVSSPFAAAQFLDRVPLGINERTFFGAPLFHGTGLSQFLLTLALGSTTVTRRKYDPRKTLEMLEEYKCETLVLVPTMLQRMLELDDEEIKKYDTRALKIIFLAGSALAPEVGNHAMELFGDVVYNLYGSTEVAVASVATPADWKKAPGTVGKVPVGCKVHIYDDDGKRITEPDVTGRIFVGSGLKFEGYTGGGSKDEIDGLLSSGDVGHFDKDGLLFIDGRDDDMIVSGGENVFPAEVENLLIEHKAIADAAVVGVKDEDFGQRLKAFVVLKDGQSLSEDEVKSHVKSELARHKVPREVEFVDDLPRNATGKLLRKELTSDE